MKPMDIIIPESLEDAPHDAVPYFIGAKDGWWKNIPTLFGVAQTQMAEGPPQLIEWKPTFLLNEVKLPGWVLLQAHDFFRTIFDKQTTESSVYILYNRVDKEFKLFAPEQYVGLSSVNHKLDREKLPKGFTPVGTIHSHCNFGAFHSGTDTNDMSKMPGLHITIGHVDHDDPEMVFALSMGDQSFDIARDGIIDESQVKNKFGYDTMPPFWPNFVHTGTAPWGTNGQIADHVNHKVWKKYLPPSLDSHVGFDMAGRGAGHLLPYESSVATSASSQLMKNWDQRAWNWETDPGELSTDDRQWYDAGTEGEYEGDDAHGSDPDPFKRYSDIVEQACDEMDELVSWLNAWGFVTSYNLTYNRTKATEQDNALREKRMSDVTGTA